MLIGNAIIYGMKEQLIYEDETYAIRGALFEVYKEMKNGYREEVYQQCLELELAARREESLFSLSLSSA